MNQLPSGKRGLEVGEKVTIGTTFGGKYRVLAIFVICIAILTAAFAASSIWRTTESGKAFFEKIEGFFLHDENEEPNGLTTTTPKNDQTTTEPPITENVIPEGAIPVASMDLSHTDRGELYYLNETSYQPAIESLLNRGLDLTGGGISSDAPLVLIVHTHTVESYLDGNADYIEGSLSAATYSADAKKNMLAVGKVLADTLNENGIPTLQCTVTHTGEDMSLQGSYVRSAGSVETYLKQYPSIRLVIDLHRDAVMTEAGEYVKTEIAGSDGKLAQVMAVVGSDSNGTPCNWEENLALALQLRRALNACDEGIARPVYLRKSSFNQELAPYSLLLEIGTGANTLEQAKRTAELVGDALAKLILKN